MKKEKYSLKRFSVQDYESYCKLWDKAPPLSSLPPNGIVINDKFYGFLALTDCDFAIITFYEFVDGVSGKDKKDMLDMYVYWCKKIALNAGKNYIFCFATKNSIIKLLESHNFINRGHGHMIAEIYNG